MKRSKGCDFKNAILRWTQCDTHNVGIKSSPIFESFPKSKPQQFLLKKWWFWNSQISHHKKFSATFVGKFVAKNFKKCSIWSHWLIVKNGFKWLSSIRRSHEMVHFWYVASSVTMQLFLLQYKTFRLEYDFLKPKMLFSEPRFSFSFLQTYFAKLKLYLSRFIRFLPFSNM